MCAFALEVFVAVASSVAVVAESALRSPGCVTWLARPSSSSFSGWVVVASFGSFAAAESFACFWAAACARSVVVRRVGSVWLVSVPVL